MRSFFKLFLFGFTLNIIFFSNLLANSYDGLTCYKNNNYVCAYQNLLKAYQDNVSANGRVEYSLAMLYIKGNGITKNSIVGAELLKEAYLSTNDDWIKYASSANLAWYYQLNIDLRNKKLSAYWAKESIKYPKSLTFNNYGVFLEEGYIFPRDINKAFEFYKKALDENDNADYFYPYSNIARFYILGRGNVRKSFDKAFYYLERALEIGGEDATSAISYYRVLKRYNRLPSGVTELGSWLEEDIIKYEQSNFLVLGWLYDDENIAEGLKWFYLQDILGENIHDREEARELIDRAEELLGYDKETISQIKLLAINWKKKYWDNEYFETEVKKEKTISTGSGFYINNNGFLITNNHVIDGCEAVQVIHDNKTMLAEIILTDEVYDLGLLKVDYKNTKSIPIAKRQIMLGQKIAASGFPLQFSDKPIINITFGNISALVGLLDNENQIQFTAPIQSGNSGGPLLNEYGELTGVVVSKLNDEAFLKYTGEVPQNVNFAIKTSKVEEFLKDSKTSYSTALIEKKYSDEEVALLAQTSTAKIVCSN